MARAVAANIPAPPTNDHPARECQEIFAAQRILIAPATPADRTLVSNLLTEALGLLETDCARARQRIEQAIGLTDARSSPTEVRKGGLAEWQLRRAVNYIAQHLGSVLRLEDVARAVKLSPSYFSRAFKISTGAAYSDYVRRARINLAKHLLLATEASIAEIALMCGLSDQAHLTRLFSRAVGLPPSRWRRAVLAQPQDGAVTPLMTAGVSAASSVQSGALADKPAWRGRRDTLAL